MKDMERIAVMEGELDGFDLAEILQAVGIGRQYTGVELRKADNTLLGTLFIKSGKLVAAASGDAQGKDAFFLVFQHVKREPRKFFHVYRTQTPRDLPQPVGNLGQLLLEALERVQNAPPALPQGPATLPPPDERQASSSVRRRRIVLGVISPKGGSGKTTIALNLSLSFARQGRSVILVDADINGDVLHSLQARERAAIGAYDVLLQGAPAASALLPTILPHFRIMPALGHTPLDPAALASERAGAWHELLDELSEQAELVIVDTPAGMFGPALQVAACCTHVLGVLQAELVACRSFNMFERSLALMPAAERPEVAGVMLNMMQTRQSGSVSVLQEACSALPAGWLLDTVIPRSEAFLQAAHEGLPLRLLDESNPPAVSWLFDTLSAELAERLHLELPQPQPRQLLV